jgi:hypothetical protein
MDVAPFLRLGAKNGQRPKRKFLCSPFERSEKHRQR